MTKEVTLNVMNSNRTTRPATILVENKQLINSVINVGQNDTVSSSDFQKLQEMAKKNGDAGILEQCDLGGEQKLKLMHMNGFAEYYDISLNADKSMFQVKIKDAGLFVKDPSLRTIKSDFGVRDNVLVKKGEIPYGNEDVIPSYAPDGDFDNVVIKTGKTINIPVTAININGTPRGFWGRLILQ